MTSLSYISAHWGKRCSLQYPVLISNREPEWQVGRRLARMRDSFLLMNEFSLAGKRSEKCLCIGSCLLEKALHMSEILGGGPLNKNIRFEVRKWQSSVAEKIR